MIVLPIQAPVQTDPLQGARAPAPPAPLVAASAASGQARNDPGPGAGSGGGAMGGGADARAAGEAHLRARLAPPGPEPKSEPKPESRPDPNRPAGPPPAFEANLLEVEREKLRAGYEPAPEAAPGRERGAPDRAGEARAAEAYGRSADLKPEAEKRGQAPAGPESGPDSSSAGPSPQQRETVAPAAASPEPPTGDTP